MRIGINGLGRIGRKLMKLVLEDNQVDLIAINDIMPIDKAVYLLKYDSTYGEWRNSIRFEENYIIIGDKKILYSSASDIQDIPWNDLSINIAVNCNGTNKSKPKLSQYLDLGIPKVILSSPPDTDDIPIFIRAFNDRDLDKYSIISNASCTTYCVAPILDIINRYFGIQFAHFSTIHCYTSDQNLQDAYHSDSRRSRAAGVNIIPTTTSATKVIKSIFPELKHKISGSSFRVPVINGSITEFLIELKYSSTPNEILNQLVYESNHRYKGIIGMISEPIVSSDVIDCPLAALIDTNSIEVIGNKIKLTAFYDNEAGYTNQLYKLILEKF